MKSIRAAKPQAMLFGYDTPYFARVMNVLRGSGYTVLPVHGAQEAVAVLERGDAELLFAIEPLPGGQSSPLLAMLIAEEQACLTLLTATDDPREALTQRGIFVLPQSANDAMIRQTAALMEAARVKLRALESHAAKLQARVEDMRIIDRAKLLLVQQLKMTEAEAHHYIEKQAMDTCRKRRAIAEGIIRTYES